MKKRATVGKLARRLPDSGRDGEIGRHASFRYLWGNTRGGSSPLLGTICFELKHAISFLSHFLKSTWYFSVNKVK